MWYVTTSRCCTASTTKSPPEALMTLFKCLNTCFFGTYMVRLSLCERVNRMQQQNQILKTDDEFLEQNTTKRMR
nr:hypothetical protein [Tanacetum cinerariifolium]